MSGKGRARSRRHLNTANAGHRAAVDALVKALTGTGKTLLHTSGSSIVGTPARGELVEAVFDEDTPFTPSPRVRRACRDDSIIRAATGTACARS